MIFLLIENRFLISEKGWKDERKGMEGWVKVSSPNLPRFPPSPLPVFHPFLLLIFLSSGFRLHLLKCRRTDCFTTQCCAALPASYDNAH
jgi:hypothetical protein